MKIIKCLAALLLSLAWINLNAQSIGEKSHIGLSGGILKYGGSLPETLTKPAFSLDYTYEITDQVHLRLQGTFSEAGASDKKLDNVANKGNDARSTYYYFNSNINEISLTPSFDLFNLNDGSRFTPYVFAGVGFYNFKPYQVVEIQRPNGTLRKENLEMQQVERFSNWQLNVPLGLGIKYALSPNVDMHLEGNYRLLFNPYLDNYMADNKNDHYYSISLGINFRLAPIAGGSNAFRRNGRNCKCPPVY